MRHLIAVLIFTCCWPISSPSGFAAERFIVMTPGPSVPYTPLLYGLDAGFFKDQGLDVQAVAVPAVAPSAAAPAVARAAAVLVVARAAAAWVRR